MQQPIQQYPQQGTVSTVMIQAPQVVKVHERWEWTGVIVSIIGFFCCTLCGLPAVIFTLLSYTDHKNQDYLRWRSKHRTAMGLGIAAIVFGIIFYLIVILVPLLRPR